MRLRHVDKHGRKKAVNQAKIHILVVFCSVILFFLQSSAQAANYLEGTAYNQHNRYTSFGSIAGTAIATYNFTTIDETDTNPAGQADYFSIVIEGFIYASVDGQYEFETLTDDGVRVKVDDTLIINNWTNHGPTIDTGTVNLSRGWIPIRIENYEWGGGHRLRFRWKPPSDSSFSYPAATSLSNVVPPADPTNSNTTVAAAPTSVVADGSTTSTLTVTLADANGNLLSASGGTVVLSSTGSATIGAVTDNGNGTYTATVTNTVAESVTISGTLDGANITDTTTITFTVGAADPTNSNTTVAAAPTSVVADGSTTSTLTVTLADANGNLLSASGGTVVLSSTGSATIGAVTDNGNGTYTATVTNTVAESVTISGTLDGANITDTATITFIDLTAPILVSSTPSDNASNVELDTNIIFNFSEDLIPGSGNIELFEENGILVESFTVSLSIISGSKVTIDPSNDLKYNFSYYIIIPNTSFKDAAGNGYSGITNNSALNFITRQKTPKESFAEIQDDISATIELNTSKRIDAFVKTTKTTVSSARDRFISNNRLNSDYNSTDQSPKANPIFKINEEFITTKSFEVARVSSEARDSMSSFNLGASDLGVIANGQLHGVRHSRDETTRYTEIQFSYTNSENSAERGGTSNQVIYEREKSDDLTVGRFIGTSLSTHSNMNEGTKDLIAVINSYSLQFGSYFVRNISEAIIIDGYIAGSLLANELEVNTTSIRAESNYISHMGATGLAATGSLPFDSWEIRPTISIDYSAVSTLDAQFQVTSEDNKSTELIAPNDMTKLSFIFSPDFRKSFNFKEGYWSQDSILSFEPQVTCQRVRIGSVTKHCDQGAAVSLNLQSKNALKKLFFTFGVDKIAEDTTYSANALYKAEF